MDGWVVLLGWAPRPVILSSQSLNFDTAATLAWDQPSCAGSVSQRDTDSVQTPLNFTARTRCTVCSSCSSRPPVAIDIVWVNGAGKPDTICKQLMQPLGFFREKAGPSYFTRLNWINSLGKRKPFISASSFHRQRRDCGFNTLVQILLKGFLYLEQFCWSNVPHCCLLHYNCCCFFLHSTHFLLMCLQRVVLFPLN